MKNNLPIISIIVPVYKAENYIYKCFDALINQTYSNIEIILINDGSPDNSGKICDEMAQGKSNVIVKHIENGGAGRARNIGVGLSSGEYIMFCDSDDHYDYTMVETLYNALINNNCDMACCGLRIIKGNEIIMQKLVFEHNLVVDKGKLIEMYFLEDMIISSPCNKIIKREIMLNNLYPEGIIAEDRMMSLKLFMDTPKTIFLNQVLYNCYMSEGSVTRSGFAKKDLVYFDIVVRDIDFTKKNYPKLLKDCYSLSIAMLLDMLLLPMIYNNLKCYRSEFNKAKELLKEVVATNNYNITKLQKNQIKVIFNINNWFIAKLILRTKNLFNRIIRQIKTFFRKG